MKLNIKEKYLIILVVLCFVAVGFYYSYAIFVTKQLQENVVVVKVNNDLVSVTIDGKKDNTVIPSNSSKDLKINITNLHSSNYKYLLLVKGIESGIKVSSNDQVEGELASQEKKEVTVHVNNTTNHDVTLDFMVKVSNNEMIDPDIGYYYINSSDNFDHSGANAPDISNLKLIPISYKETSDKEGYWYKADNTNQMDLWYSYENGIWANAALVNDTNYNKYKNSSVGTEIEIGDILGFYVWIPRFKYYIINNNNYTNYERITNVIFEKEDNTTGTVTCLDKISTKEDSHIYSEVCTDNYYNHIYDNLSTYTHPAFRDNNGFWVSKFLIGDNEKSLPNVSILKKKIDEANTISDKYNSHVLTNMEYGAIILLSNSIYGKTGNSLYQGDDNVFTRIYSNTYEYGTTGCSSEYTMYSKSYITDTTKKCIEYNDLSNYSHISNSVNYPIGYIGAGASSTGTVYGVYDLASITGELTSAYVLDSSGIINTTSKYFDKYSNNEFIGKVSSSGNIYNLYRYKLGDGIREHFRSFTDAGMWNSGYLIQNTSIGIIVRGANSSVYNTSIEEVNYTGSFRLVLN